MTNLQNYGLVAHLAKKAPSGWIGRTALMKFCYLLQAVRKVPLGYHFTLYSYGPFDSSVLSDLGVAEALGLVHSTLANYPSGYGYRIECATTPEEIEEIGGDLLVKHRDDIDWVVSVFGSKNAAELELLATIIYVDRERDKQGGALTTDELVSKVHDVKPHFSASEILDAVQELQGHDLLI